MGERYCIRVQVCMCVYVSIYVLYNVLHINIFVCFYMYR